MIKFFIPILYSIETRYARKLFKGVTLFLLVYLIPQFVLKVCFASSCSILIWIISVVLVLNLYEVGYIENDTETIKKENKPTKRLSDEELLFYERHKIVIYITRLFIATGISIVVLMQYNFSIYSKLILAVLWMLLPLYHIYNSIRNIWNLPLLTILTSYRCIMPMILCMTMDMTIPILAYGIIYAYLVYPFPTILQQCVMGKFGIEINLFKKIIISDFSSRNVFRIKYYALFTLILVILLLFGFVSCDKIILPIYYLIVRLLEEYNFIRHH